MKHHLEPVFSDCSNPSTNHLIFNCLYADTTYYIYYNRMIIATLQSDLYGLQRYKFYAGLKKKTSMKIILNTYFLFITHFFCPHLCVPNCSFFAPCFFRFFFLYWIYLSFITTTISNRYAWASIESKSIVSFKENRYNHWVCLDF